MKLGLIYTNAPVGVGGQISKINLYPSNSGLGDQNFQGKVQGEVQTLSAISC